MISITTPCSPTGMPAAILWQCASTYPPQPHRFASFKSPRRPSEISDVRAKDMESCCAFAIGKPPHTHAHTRARAPGDPRLAWWCYVMNCADGMRLDACHPTLVLQVPSREGVANRTNPNLEEFAHGRSYVEYDEAHQQVGLCRQGMMRSS